MLNKRSLFFVVVALLLMLAIIPAAFAQVVGNCDGDGCVTVTVEFCADYYVDSGEEICLGIPDDYVYNSNMRVYFNLTGTWLDLSDGDTLTVNNGTQWTYRTHINAVWGRWYDTRIRYDDSGSATFYVELGVQQVNFFVNTNDANGYQAGEDMDVTDAYPVRLSFPGISYDVSDGAVVVLPAGVSIRTRTHYNTLWGRYYTVWGHRGYSDGAPHVINIEFALLEMDFGGNDPGESRYNRGLSPNTIDTYCISIPQTGQCVRDDETIVMPIQARIVLEPFGSNWHGLQFNYTVRRGHQEILWEVVPDFAVRDNSVRGGYDR